MTEDRHGFTGELRLGRDLTGSTQVLVRSLTIIIGLVLVLSDTAYTLSNARTAWASLVVLAVLGLTLPNIIELLGGSGERSTTFLLITDTLGKWIGFSAGWSIFAGYAVLSAIFLRSASIVLLPYLGLIGVLAVQASAALVLLIILNEVFQILPRQRWIRPLVLICGTGLFFAVLSVLPAANIGFVREYQSPAPNFLRAAALLVLGFAAMEEILSLRHRIREPERHMRPALIQTGIALVVFFMVFPLLLGATGSGMVALSEGGITQVVVQEGAFPTWLVRSMSSLLLLAAGALSTSAAVRQFQRLILAGAFPPVMSRSMRPFRMPPLVYAGTAALVLLALVLIPLTIALEVAAGLFLLPLLILNIAAIHSRQTEPERRRPFETPFYPVIPLAGIALALSLFLALSLTGAGLVLAWLLVGLLYYVFYARTEMVEAQEGLLVFRREPHQPKPEGAYRILVPISAGVERHLLLEMASSLAEGLHGEVIPLQVIPMADPLAVEEGQRIAYERNTLFQWSTRDLARPGVITSPITRLARSIPDGILDTAAEEDCDLILLSWSIRGDDSNARLGRILDPVVRGATCDLAVVAFQPEQLQRRAEAIEAMQADGVEEPGETKFSLKRILVPTAGGPHAPLATRLALILAREYDAQVHSVYVTSSNPTEDEVSAGRERIVSTLDCMRGEAEELGLEGDNESGLERFLTESQIIPANSIVEGIVAASESSDLVLIGASEESLLDQVMFGTLPEQVAREASAPVAMVKRYQGLRRFWIQRVWDTIYEAIPTLSGPEQLAIYKQIHRQARPDVDFFIMMGLSALIATFGLLQSSSAVIIGAMLVAPLFTPLIALSMGIVLGNIRLLRLAVEAAVKGVAVAVGVATLITALSPLKLGTAEILARTQPNLFDLAVALASGIAGAYAVARKDVATSLPGVAIAAALVPPLSVIGIGLAMGDMDIAGGGSLLFATNMIAITFAGAITFLQLGFRPTSRREGEARLRTALQTSILLLVIISIPLASVFISTVRESGIEQILDEALVTYFEADEALDLVDFTFTPVNGSVEIHVTCYVEEDLGAQVAADLQQVLSERLDDDVLLTVTAIPVQQVELP